MLKQLMLSKKIELKRTSVDGINTEIAELEEKKLELERMIDEIKEDEELETVEQEVSELEEKKSELEEEKSKLEEEIAELEAQIAEINNKEQNNDEGERAKGGKKMELRQAIGNYVRTKQLEDVRAVEGFKIVDGGVLVPEEILKPYKKPEEEVDLKKLVNVVKVNRGSGAYPIIKKSTGKMVSVAELEANPELAKPEIDDVQYAVSTYRGYIPVSQEVIDDADFDVTGLIGEAISDQELNTTNAAIATVLKSATPKAVTGIDGLKEIFNVSLKKVYSPKAILSASLYNELDTTKDNNGRYLLQDDITVASGKKLFGYEVVVLDDEMIGTTTGDLVGFIGDPKAFATFFDRKQASAKWIEHNIYGQLLAGYIRFDVKAVDADAGFYVTYTPETPEA